MSKLAKSYLRSSAWCAPVRPGLAAGGGALLLRRRSAAAAGARRRAPVQREGPDQVTSARSDVALEPEAHHGYRGHDQRLHERRLPGPNDSEHHQDAVARPGVAQVPARQQRTVCARSARWWWQRDLSGPAAPTLEGAGRAPFQTRHESLVLLAELGPEGLQVLLCVLWRWLRFRFEGRAPPAPRERASISLRPPHVDLERASSS